MPTTDFMINTTNLGFGPNLKQHHLQLFVTKFLHQISNYSERGNWPEDDKNGL